MDENVDTLEKLLREHLSEYGITQPQEANSIQAKLDERSKSERLQPLLMWWKDQPLPSIFDLQRYAFWLWTEKGIDYDLFEAVYYTLTPVESRSRSVPVVITTGLDDPQIEGGFREKTFSILNFRFSPSARGFLVNWSEPPPTTISLETVLEFLSFAIEKGGSVTLGFRPLLFQESRSSKTRVTETTMGSEIQTIPLDYDFDGFEGPLQRINSLPPKSGMSLTQLLHIRHRSILDTNLESKLISLWASIEAQWGTEQKDDHLLAKEEEKTIEERLKFLVDENAEDPSQSKAKYNRVINHIKTLRRRTKNERIIEGISRLACARDEEVRERVRGIHALRSKCVHGTLLEPTELETAQRHIQFMMRILNELITEEMRGINILFYLYD